MADQLAFLPERVLTAAAMPGTGYRVQFYQSGTTTPVTVYNAPDLLTPITQPITCDASGVFPQVFSAGGAVKAVVTKPDTSVFYTVDPVFRVPTSASGASDITFSPTGPLPYTNVQAAIEGSVAAAASGFNAFGLGITGNAALLANIDTTGTGAGVYRFDGASTGTFPAGVTAATTGIVTIDRQTAAEAVMTLRAAGASRVFMRLLAASAWGAWREVATLPATFGTAGQVPRVNTGATALEYADGVALQTSVGASGQTSIPFTGIPAWVKRITVVLSGLSTNGTATVTVRIGDSGGIENTGYSGTCSAVANGSTAASAFATGFAIDFGAGDTAAATRSGAMTLQRLSGNTWVCASVMGLGNAVFTSTTAGTKTLSDVLTQLTVTTINGTDTFDVGNVAVSWE